jgi:tetratricopeptide (TPR) repeat protein
MGSTKADAVLSEALKAGAARNYEKAIEILMGLVAGEDAPIEAILYLGRSYQALGKFDRAIVAFRSFLNEGGEPAAGNFFLGRAYLASGRTEEASLSLKRSLEAKPDHAAAWALLGAAQLRLKRSKLAVDCLEKAVTFAPGDARIFHGYLNALFVRACKLLRQGDADMARQILSFVIDNGLDGAGPRLWKARALRELGHIDEALADCERAIGFAPEDGSLRWLRASLLLTSGREEEALEEFEALRVEYPDLPGFPGDERAMARLRASVAFRDEKWKEAAEASLAILRAEPKDPSLQALAAESLRALGQAQRSCDHWKRAIAADPNAAEFRLGLALSLFEIGDYEGAQAQVERAKRLGADDDEVEYCAALIAAKNGDKPEALMPRLQALIRQRGADPRLMFALGEALYRSGRPDLASGWFEKVHSLVPDHELSLLYRISVAESLEDSEALGPAYEDYLESYPDNADMRREYVDHLMRLELWDDAAAALEVGLSYGESGERNRRILALAYRNAGRYREAAVIYRDFLRQKPENSEYLLALALCLERDGQGEYALALLERAPEAAKRGAAPWIVLGLLYERRGRKEAAVDALRKATDLEGSNARAWKDLGLLYKRMGLAEFSANCLERATSLGAVLSPGELGAAPAKPAATKKAGPAKPFRGAAKAAATPATEIPRPTRPRKPRA